jgi:hypothetical protein
VLVVGALVWVVNGVVRWWLAMPLGHDEARYALDARDWIAGEPTRFWYSGGGMTLVAAPGILAGATERALRLVPLILGTGFLASAYLCARHTCGPITAGWTVGVLAGSRTMTTHGAELLSDLPSAGCLLLAIAILLVELGREDGPRWRVLGIAPLFAAAFYVRYGSVVAIIAISAAFALVGLPALLRRPLRIAATVGLFAALLLPHALHSLELSGSVTGVLRGCSDMQGPSTGLSEYMRTPLAFYGPIFTALMFVAIVAAPRHRLIVALQLASVFHFAIMTLQGPAYARFVYLPTVLLGMLGIDAVVRLLQHVGPRTRIAATVAALATVSGAWVVTFVRIPYHDRARRHKPREVLEQARKARALEHPCALTYSGPDALRLEWYSGCRVDVVDDQASASARPRVNDPSAPASGPEGSASAPGAGN